MANYSELLNDINAAIYENNDQEIDALEVRAILREMVTSLGSGFLFKGIATPSSPSGTGTYEPDQNVFYLATTAGTYTYLGGLVVAAGEVAFLCFDGTWTKKSSALLSTGSIVDNLTTNDATKPLSAKQGKVLADAGAATAAEVTALGQELGEFQSNVFGSQFQKNLVWSNGYIRKNDGGIASSTASKYTQPFTLKKGEKVTIGTANSNICIIGTTNAQSLSVGDFVTVIQATSNSGAFETYTYTAQEDITLVLCVKWSDYSLSFEQTESLSDLISDVGISIAPTSVGESGKYIPFNQFESEVQPSANTNYSITNPISVPAHSIIQTSSYGADCRIAKVTGTGYIPLVAGINTPNSIVGWTNTSDSAVSVVVSYIVTDLAPLKVWVYSNVFADIIGKYPEIERLGKLNDITPSITWVDGQVVSGEVKTTAFGGYKHCSVPIAVKKGDIVFIKDARSGYINAALFKTDNSFSYAKNLLGGTEGTTAVSRYYIIDFDGYIGFACGYNALAINCRIFRLSEGILPEIIKRGDKKHIGLAISSSQTINVESIGFCPVTKSLAKRISGSGNATITCTLAEQAIGRTFSIGFRVPYSFQDVAKLTMNGANIPMASNDERTASGKAYLIEGDHFHRCNFDAVNVKLLSFTIQVTSSSAWAFEISGEGVVNDDMPLIPVMVGYDLAYNYQATFPYNGENISIYELHKRLNIPYYVALTGDTDIVNPEIIEAIESGLCERVFYGGGNLAGYWDETDGSLSQQMILKKSAKEGMGTMYVVSQSVLDRNIYSAIINSGFDIIRHWGASENRQGEFGQMPGDNNVYYGILAALGNSVLYKIMNFPQLWYGHGIGTPIDPDDPYASNYADSDGSKTIELFNLWKTLESRGQLAVMKPSDWIAYLKKCH